MSFAQPRGASHASAALAVIAAAILVGACSKGEPQSTSARPNAPLQVPKSTSTEQREAGVDALKERLARQEAAARLFEKSAPEPRTAPKAVVAEPPKPVPVPTPAPEPKKAEPAKAPEPVKTAAATTPAPASAARAPEPAKAEAPPRVDVAAARPPPAPAPAPSPARLLSKVDPDFPREAIQAGADNGSVKARMTLDAGGNVTKVDVVEATPRRLFDRAVVRALSQWKFSEGSSGRTVETEVEFKR
jgi:protein TonB